MIAWSLCLAPAGSAQSAAPTRAGQMTWAMHFTLAPRWLDPAETEGSITPFLTLYAVHDALLKPMPSGPSAPSLAESWTVSPNGLVYEFVLRASARLHNGERVTAEDVKFSFERYHGANATALKEHVREVRVAYFLNGPVAEEVRRTPGLRLMADPAHLGEKKIFAPIWENGFIRGVGPRVEEPALTLIPAFPYSAPYEDVRLKP